MTHFYKILILAVLLLGSGFIGFSLGTPTAEAPKEVLSTPSEATDRGNEEILPPTENTTTGVTRDLSNQGLQEVSRAEFEKIGTEILNLSGNNLTSLQAEIRQLSNLRVLDLSDNMLTNIPAELGQLSKLEILNLRNNTLTGLPYELGNLKNLKTLDLRGNDYTVADLTIIKESLPKTTVILTD